MVLVHGGAYATVSADGPCALKFNMLGPFMHVPAPAEEVESKHLASLLGKDPKAGVDGSSADMGSLLEECVVYCSALALVLCSS